MKHFTIIFSLVVPIVMNGQASHPDPSRLSHPSRIQFTPSSFSNSFSLHVKPVLTIQTGDTILTETIDAAGYDRNGVKRQRGGNPLTGPFYVEGSHPGDVLAVTITRLATNRATAFTTESFVSRSLPKGMVPQSKKPRLVHWSLDTANHVAILKDSSYAHLRDFLLPLKPFLGCIGVAPSNKKDEILSFFQGSFGGNMDFEAITESATIYLPVFHEGSYLFIGDGHALQGHGEIAGNALETSLNVEFTVKVISHEKLAISFPRLEDERYLMSVGTAKTLDQALKTATAGLLEWLQRDYQLSVEEATQVMSTCIEYTIAEIADPNVEVVAKIKKTLLAQLKKFD